MPINAYTGLMGSGKSYEVVSSVIVMAVLHGRRVVTNVDSIHSDLIRDYCHKKYGKPYDDLGSVVHCTNDDVAKADFLPHGTDVPTLVQPGDLVAIDEAWRFWGTDCKLHNEHKIFFREHRHYVHPVTFVSCDLVVMVQDISDLHRYLKVVVELTFRTHKKKTLGLNKTYSLEMFEGYKLNAKTRVQGFVKKYDPEIFPLYASYQGGTGKEKTVDDRQNIFKNPTLILMMVAVLLLGIGSLFFAWRFFHKNPAEKKPSTSTAQTQTSGLPQQPAPKPKTVFSESWRVVGSYDVNDSRFAVIADREGRLRVVSISTVTNSGAWMMTEIDGEPVTRFSGGSPAPSLMGESK